MSFEQISFTKFVTDDLPKLRKIIHHSEGVYVNLNDVVDLMTRYNMFSDRKVNVALEKAIADLGSFSIPSSYEDPSLESSSSDDEDVVVVSVVDKEVQPEVEIAQVLTQEIPKEDRVIEIVVVEPSSSSSSSNIQPQSEVQEEPDRQQLENTTVVVPPSPSSLVVKPRFVLSEEKKAIIAENKRIALEKKNASINKRPSPIALDKKQGPLKKKKLDSPTKFLLPIKSQPKPYVRSTPPPQQTPMNRFTGPAVFGVQGFKRDFQERK